MKHMTFVKSEVGQYFRSKIASLGDVILRKQRIYLDVNYWIHLADALDGKPRHPDYSRLLSILETLVDSGNTICVVGDDTLLELFKRKDLSKRLLLARTMDRLSAGTIIQHSFERAELEISEFLFNTTKEKPCSPPAHLVWRRPCYFLGDIFPIPGPQISPQEAALLSKAYLDYSWGLSFESMVERLGSKSPPPSNWDLTADFINVANLEHQIEVGNFDDLFLKEADGVLDVISLDVAHRRVRDDVTGATTVSDALEAYQEVKAKVLAAFKQHATGNALPYIDIQAGVHTAIRRNKKRRLKPNDFHDFGHAAAAIPYCSAFLTDGPLKTLLCNRPLNFARRYGCHVVASVSEVFGLFDGSPTSE